MAPRSYAQSRRAETAAATRDRILDAAVDEYRERGVAGTTLSSVATRADVSRGTILHHFGGADGLLEAVADRVIESLDPPDERILAGLVDPEARMRAFVAAMVGFFERSTPWWQVFASEMQRPALQAREAAYWAGLGKLQAAALGRRLDGSRAAAIVSALMHPAALGALLWTLELSGLDREERIAVVGNLIVDVVTRQEGLPMR